MSDLNACQQLHKRATSGGVLTAEEKAQLEAWYAEVDAAEDARLRANAKALPDLAAIEAEIKVASAEVATLNQRLNAQHAEIEILRQQNAALKQRLAQKTTKQPA